ncbi:Sec-independent protein translocase subunit TatA [Georgenia sp. H159]|uniref:Sec-independent protein translocase subunit TatA n=1 Tax=Georgenia sp. H159 TaxID=3076115 RepID=UPI002D79D09A|nr:Sec-independent protein translocase subunit TatA [Georgenia sp. H159]
MRPTHILVLLIVLIILFGAKRLPDVARSVGQSLKVFKKEVAELQEDLSPAATAPAQQSAPTGVVQPQPVQPHASDVPPPSAAAPSPARSPER